MTLVFYVIFWEWGNLSIYFYLYDLGSFRIMISGFGDLGFSDSGFRIRDLFFSGIWVSRIKCIGVVLKEIPEIRRGRFSLKFGAWFHCVYFHFVLAPSLVHGHLYRTNSTSACSSGPP